MTDIEVCTFSLLIVVKRNSGIDFFSYKPQRTFLAFVTIHCLFEIIAKLFSYLSPFSIIEVVFFCAFF